MKKRVAAAAVMVFVACLMVFNENGPPNARLAGHIAGVALSFLSGVVLAL